MHDVFLTFINHYQCLCMWAHALNRMETGLYHSAGLNATHCCSEPPTEKLECLYHGTTFTDKIMVQMSKTCILINICVCVKFHGSGMQWKHVMNQKRDTVVGLIFFDK